MAKVQQPDPTPGEIAQQLVELVVGEAGNLDELGKRIVANRLLEVLGGWSDFEKKKPGPTGVYRLPPPMTDVQAKAFDRERVDFGKYMGRRWETAPLSYVRYLCDASRALWLKLYAYLHSDYALLEERTAHEEDEDDEDGEDTYA